MKYPALRWSRRWIGAATLAVALAAPARAAEAHREESVQTQGANSRRAAEAKTPASPDAPTISFIDSQSATCYKPDPRQDLCFVTWGYNSVSASASQYIVSMRFTLDGRLVANTNGFFQSSVYLPGGMFGPGFRVSCGPPVSAPDPNDPMSTILKGNDYSWKVDATETGGLKAANYGSVSCPAYFPADGGPVVSIFPASLARTQPANTTSSMNLAIQNTATFSLFWDLPVSRFAGCVPGSVPWLSPRDTTGVTAGLGRETIPVAFDSTGLTPGTYGAHLCVSSSDRYSPRIDVPATLTVPCQGVAASLYAESLRVDEHAASIGTANHNGVLEPGEVVLVDPAWKNAGCADADAAATATAFTGPAGATYTRYDSAADYGIVAPVAASSCLDATANCYTVVVSKPAVRPAVHWDANLQELVSGGAAKTWKLHVGGSFTDVPTSQPFYRRIETLFHTGITAGCTANAYCPGDGVTRAQMAIFIARGIAGGGAAVPDTGTVGSSAYNCASGGTSLFSDVAPTDIYCKHVHFIAARDVTLGCGGGKFCPADSVNRLQMAGFMAKAIVEPVGGPGVPAVYPPDPVTGLSYSCDASSPSVHFSDVSESSAFCKHVHFLWARGVIGGCSGSLYCPGDLVTRDAMARFLTNAFDLKLYGP